MYRKWEHLIADICGELYVINSLPEKSIEDIWVRNTLIQVLRKMCALHKLPPKMHKLSEGTRPLFGVEQD